MKSTGRCPKCNDTQIGRLAGLVDQAHGGNLRPRTLGQKRTGNFLLTRIEMHASVEAYVCICRGYFEEYVTAPDGVPWEELASFSWVNGPRAGPCRRSVAGSSARWMP